MKGANFRKPSSSLCCCLVFIIVQFDFIQIFTASTGCLVSLRVNIIVFTVFIHLLDVSEDCFSFTDQTVGVKQQDVQFMRQGLLILWINITDIE